jgi:lipoprotein-releasing system permease protein
MLDVPPRSRQLAEEARRLHEELEQLQRSMERGSEMRREYDRNRQGRLGALGDPGSGEGTGSAPGTGLGAGLDGEARQPVVAPSREAEGTGGGFVMPLLPGQGPRSPAPPGDAGPSGAPSSPLALPGFGPLGPDPTLRRQAPGVVVGTELAQALHVSVGDELTIISPDGQLLPTGPAPLSRPFTVVALFYSGLYEFDRRFAYVLTDEARDLFRMGPGEVTAVDVKVGNLERSARIEAELIRELAGAGVGGLLVRSWEKLNQSLFSALELEKFALFIILTIIILVASFSIASSLVVMVIERSQEIGILKSMGTSNREIMGIFAIAGGVIGALGTSLGVVIGVGLCVALQTYGWPLDTEVYYIEYLPVHLEPVEVVLTALAGMMISLGATVYPAVKAARLNPADALRND